MPALSFITRNFATLVTQRGTSGFQQFEIRVFDSSTRPDGLGKLGNFGTRQSFLLFNQINFIQSLRPGGTIGIDHELVNLTYC